MKILQIVGDSKYGGATYLIVSWCQFLLNKGCDVTLLTTDRSTISVAREVQGIKICDSILIPRDINVIQDIKALIQLQQFISENEYDIIHTHTSTPGFVGRLAAWLNRTPVRLHTAHGWPVTEATRWLARGIFTSAEYIAGIVSSRVICVSHATAYQGKKIYIVPQQKVVTICNGIEPEPFLHANHNESKNNTRLALNIAPDYLLIGATGRLAEQKDMATLIRAVPFLKALLPDRPFLLLLAGDGPERAQLEALTHSLEISSYVRFLGFYTDIPGFLAALDIFVSSSLWEGLSISIMEAMASALPIVTTNILPNAELIEHEVTGLLVPPKSPEAIAQAIKRFIDEPELSNHCAENARKRLMERYTIDRMFQETWDLYLDLLARNKRK